MTVRPTAHREVGSMSKLRSIPVIIGVGDVRDTFTGPEGAEEPLYLMLQAVHAAARDTKLPPYASENLVGEVDSIDVVRTWTWPYDDLASDLAREMGAKPSHKVTTARHGGDQPAKLIDEAARRISFGQSKIALVTGGEALASLSTRIASQGSPPPHWTKTSHSLDSVLADGMKISQGALGGAHRIGAPIQVYPLYENALRAHREQSLQQNNAESAQMYAAFAKSASQNEYAWTYGKTAESEQTIATVSKRNRMICFPYPLLMNAFNSVNLAAACILTSTDYAHELRILESQWVFVRGGARTSDSEDFWRRPNFYTSPSISGSIDAALEAANILASEIDAYDFYSCFPIVPKLACAHLGLSTTPPYPKPITLLGGLTSFGGAGNNYSMHAFTHMTRHLREGKGRNGLILANGGVITYQHTVCLSTEPPLQWKKYPESNPLPGTSAVLPDSLIEVQPNGEATVETYTVDFGRDGRPVLGHIVGKLVGNRKRFLANHGNEQTLLELSSRTKDPIGRHGCVRSGEGGRNFFSFEQQGKL